MCKRLVELIWHGEIDSFFIIIPFQLNSTKNFTIPMNSDVVVFFNVLIRWLVLCFPKKLAPKLLTKRMNVVGRVR